MENSQNFQKFGNLGFWPKLQINYLRIIISMKNLNIGLIRAEIPVFVKLGSSLSPSCNDIFRGKRQ